MKRDGTGKCPVRWYIDDLGKKKWVCFAHLAPYSRHNESSETCWYSTCPGRSMVGYPYTEEELNEMKAKKAKEAIKKAEKVIQVQEPKLKCANYGCGNLVASNRKKYCSDKCRKQKSRADYEKRNPNRKKSSIKVAPTSPPKIEPPKTKKTPVKPKPTDICTSIICDNKVPPNRKAYCSDICRKRAYRQRQKGLL